VSKFLLKICKIKTRENLVLYNIIVHGMIAFTILQIADQLMTQLVQRNVTIEIALLRNPTEAAQVLVS